MLYRSNIIIYPTGASIVNIADYSPFGVQLDGRTAESEDYRYGFQNQEKDDEIKGKGNSVNYKYRMHDPRVGRFFAVDPLFRKYPYNSSYAFSENVVINAIELEGLELFFVNGYRGFYAGKLESKEMENYWKTSWGFVTELSNYFNQDDIRYLDGHLHDGTGSPFSDPIKERATQGFIDMYAMLESGELTLSNAEPVTFVAHSQGNAYALGAIKAIQAFQKGYNALEENKDKQLDVAINMVAIALFQGGSFTAKNLDINVIQFTYDNDLYGCNPMDGVLDANGPNERKFDERIAKDEEGYKMGRLDAHSAGINQREAFDAIVTKDKKEGGVFEKKKTPSVSAGPVTQEIID